MLKFNPYLNFPGNAEEAFNYYKTVFGGEFTMVSRFGDSSEVGPVAEEDKDKIMHIGLQVAPETVLMGSDASDSMGHKLTIGNNFYISINAESRNQADEIFTKLSNGGKIEMPLTDVFWGDYFGMVMDKYNIRWMMSYNQRQQS